MRIGTRAFLIAFLLYSVLCYLVFRHFETSDAENRFMRFVWLIGAVMSLVLFVGVGCFHLRHRGGTGYFHIQDRRDATRNIDGSTADKEQRDADNIDSQLD